MVPCWSWIAGISASFICIQAACNLHTDCMKSKRRTQTERSAATRGALVAAARRLWSERGYTDVGTPEIAAAAGVTRGAMYHQFTDKAALFLAVAEAVETDVTTRLGEFVVASGAGDPAAALHAAVDGWLEACEEPEVRQVLLLDGPVVLGWDGFRDMALRHGLGLTEAMPRATRWRACCTRSLTGCSRRRPQGGACDDRRVKPSCSRAAVARRNRAGAGSAGTHGRARRRAAGRPRRRPPRRPRARAARRTPAPPGRARRRG